MGIFKTGRTFSEAVRNSMTYCGEGYIDGFSSSREADAIIGDLQL